MFNRDFDGSTSKKSFQSVLLILAVLAVYGASLANGFVWDDPIFFINNPVYRDFNIRAIFFSLANGVEYLPVRDLTYALDFLLWGDNPLGFHLTNIVFFSANVLLVFALADLVCRRISLIDGRTIPSSLPLLVAAIFALHPINAEVANFVTCRNALVSGVCFFFACLCMIRFFEHPSRVAAKWYGASLLAFTVAMFGKATAIIFPLLLLFILPILFPGQIRRIVIFLLPFFAVAAGCYLIFSKIAVSAGITGLKYFELTFQTISRLVAVAVQIPFFYLGKLIVPSGFSVDYGVIFNTELSVPQVVASIGGLVFLGVLIPCCRRKMPEVSLGICWFLIALIPVLNFFGTYPVVADRYVFLPLFGFILAVVSVLNKLIPVKLKSLVFGSLLLLLAGISVARTFDWRTDETLWKANIRNYPDNTKSYLNLAAYYFNRGQHQKALTLLESSREVPWIGVYLDYYRGRYFLEQKDFARAKESFHKALNVVNGYIGALYYLGYIGEKEGDYGAAVQYYNRAINSDERDYTIDLPAVRSRLKMVKQTWLDREILTRKQQLEQNPGNMTVRKDLALFLDQLGFYAEAVEQYLLLEKGGIKGWQIHQNIANCYFNLHQSSQAIHYYKQVVESRQGTEETFNNLGISYRKLEEYDTSIRILQQGHTLFPDSSYIAFNLAVSYFVAGQREAARDAFIAVTQKFPEFRDKAAVYLRELTS